VPLSQLQTLRPEMEFWFPSDGLVAARVDALCRQHILPGRERPALAERSLHGMLMGFADLVFEHAGSAWVLDYKSNHLGDSDADYGLAAMEQAVLAHRYDVQAALYLLALQRLLRARQGSRADGVAPPRPGTTGSPRPAGAIFLFLRGIGHDAAGCLTLRPPPALIDALDTMLSAANAMPSSNRAEARS